MSVLRRAWRVLADPPTSDTARLLRLGVPLWGLAAVIGYVVPGWIVPPHRVIDVAWLYAVLVVVRQRDQARAKVAGFRANVDCSCNASGRILTWPSTPNEVFVRCGACNGRVTPARKARAATRDRPAGW